MRFVLAGQPNSGKSTIFNAVAGYRSATANFPGSSVSYTVSRALILGREVEVVDLPGIYSMTSTDATANEGESYLLDEDYDLIIDVVDASRLGRSLELTLQLLELRRPVLVALNMMDEAERRGIQIEAEELERRLGVPVVPTIGRRGRGLKELFRKALQLAHAGDGSNPLCYDREVEEAVDAVVGALEEKAVEPGPPLRFAAAKLLERDPHVEERVYGWYPSLEERVGVVREDLERAHGWTSDQVVSGSRHAVAHAIEEETATLERPNLGWRERVDRVLLHPWTGGPVMVLILGGLFWMVFGVGQRIEAPLVDLFDRANAALAAQVPHDSLLGTVASGVVLGLAGGVAIVLPYLVPFLIGLAILEDTGYLPRIAYILDNFMHRIGLHGKSVLPLILGYGCSVPAIMSTRILESKRDRRITAALALILEIPDLSVPHAKTLAAKTWLTLREFITIAWPLLIASSVVLGLLEYAKAHDSINAILAPLTVWTLGLPAAVGMTLVFGVLRKELTMVMLVQALGTTHVDTVMTTVQLLTFTLFVVFYVPCVATVAVLGREMGWRDTAWIAGLTIVVATAIAIAGRFAFAVFA
jgi:ferrous iron transport protein B